MFRENFLARVKEQELKASQRASESKNVASLGAQLKEKGITTTAAPSTAKNSPKVTKTIEKKSPKGPAAKQSAKSASKPAAKSASKPAAKSASKPAAKPAAKSAAKAAAKPAAKSAAKAAKSTATPAVKTSAATPTSKTQDGVLEKGFKGVNQGVKFEVLKAGKPGALATKGSCVAVRYSGSLAKTGKRFDKGNMSVVLGKGECVKGFELGIQGMALGETRRILIPAKLGYGGQRQGPIPPNSDLVFELELKKL